MTMIKTTKKTDNEEISLEPYMCVLAQAQISLMFIKVLYVPRFQS